MSYASLTKGKYPVFVLFLALIASLPSAANAVEIDDCGFVADEPGEYVVTQDLLDNASPTCITIDSDDVVLDCAGHTIQAVATPQAGVYASNVNNIVVKNCIIQGFTIPGYGAGIKFYGVTNSTVENNVLTGNGDGIIVSMQIPNAQKAVEPLEFGGNVLKGNTVVKSNGNGIILSETDGNAIEGNTIAENDKYGIYVSYSNGNAIDGNTVNSNNCNPEIRESALQGCGGIILVSSDDNTLKNNEVKKNGGYAVKLDYSGNNVLESNTIESNYGTGVYITLPAFAKNGESGNTLKGNSISSNYEGVYVEYVSGNTFENNVINSNEGDGISLQYSSGNIFSNDEVRLNGRALYAYESAGTFTNDAIKDSSGGDAKALQAPDVWLEGNSDLSFISVDFDKNEVYFGDESSVLRVYWFVNVHVTNLNNTPVGGAAVSIKDVNGFEAYSGVTDANGVIPTQTIIEYVQDGALESSSSVTPNSSPTFNSILATTNYTPHSIAALKYGVSKEAQAQVTQDVDITIQLALDNVAPVISNVHIVDVTQNTVTIGWDTDEAANETINYGASTAYALTYSNAAFATGHSAFLTGLSAGTLYHYKIRACDFYANCAETEDYTFTTISSSGGASGGGGSGLPGGISPSSSPSPSASPTKTVSLGGSSSVEQSLDGTYTTFKLKHVATGAFDGYIEWELPIECADFLNGIVYFTPDVFRVSCGSIKAVWEVKFLKAGEEFNAKVTVRRQLPADAVNDVKGPKLTPRETTKFEPTVTVLPTVAAMASVEAPQSATGLVSAGPSNDYWLVGTIIAVAAIAAIAFYARKHKTT